MALLRGMNPQVLAVDEITRSADAEALLQAAGCGTALLATAHAGCVDDLKRRGVYRRLVQEGIFERFVMVEGTGQERNYRVMKRGDTGC